MKNTRRKFFQSITTAAAIIPAFKPPQRQTSDDKPQTHRVISPHPARATYYLFTEDHGRVRAYDNHTGAPR